MEDTTETLIQRFVIDRDEAAFQALAARYLGLIFNTAFRRTSIRPQIACQTQIAKAGPPALLKSVTSSALEFSWKIAKRDPKTAASYLHAIPESVGSRNLIRAIHEAR